MTVLLRGGGWGEMTNCRDDEEINSAELGDCLAKTVRWKEKKNVKV